VLCVKVSASPIFFHDPGVVGDRLGLGEFFASAEENVTVIGVPPATPTAPDTGLTETMLRATGGAVEVLDEERRAPTPDVFDLDGEALWLVRVMTMPTAPPTMSAHSIAPPTRRREVPLGARYVVNAALSFSVRLRDSAPF